MVEELRPLPLKRGKVGSKTVVKALEQIRCVITVHPEIMPKPCGWMELSRRYAVFVTEKVSDGHYRVAHVAMIAVSHSSAIPSSVPEVEGPQATHRGLTC